MSSHTSRARTKGKRYLPSIPFEGDGVKRTVTFNQETIETSIGGTQTPGKIKGAPLSPMKRLSTDESSLRSESWEGVNDCNNSDISTSLTLKGNRMSNSFNTSNQDISIDISVTKEMTSSGPDKENSPSGSISVNGDLKTPVKGTNIFNGQREDTNFDKNLENLQLFEPSLTMRIRTPTLRRHTLDEKLLGTPDCYSYVQLDKPRYEVAYNNQFVNDVADSCSVTVAVRVRPFSQRYKIYSIYLS